MKKKRQLAKPYLLGYHIFVGGFDLMTEKGVFSNGIPYVRFGKGEKALLVFYGGRGNDPPSGLMLRMFTSAFKSLSQNHVVYVSLIMVLTWLTTRFT